MAELGYWIGEPYWGNGFATEAVGAVVTFGFQCLGLDMICAECHLENAAAHSVQTKNGMIMNAVQGNVFHYRFNKGEYDEQVKGNGKVGTDK